MIALLLKLGGWITDHPKSAFALVFLAGGLLGVLAGRRLCETPSLKAEETQSTAAFGREVLDRKTEEGPWSVRTWEWGPVSAGVGTDSRQRVPAPAMDRGLATLRTEPAQAGATPNNLPATTPQLLRYSEETHAAIATETHSERESAQSTTQTLKLTQEAGNTPTWALGASLEGAFDARILRLSVRRKLLGPIWVEGAFTPATRAVGAGLSIQF